MVFPVNKMRKEFKDQLLRYMLSVEYGTFISDDDLKKLLIQFKVDLSFDEVMLCIRQIEYRIGVECNKRLKRIRNEGYLVLEPEDQVNTALREGKQKVNVALKNTARRLKVVDANQFTPEQQRELLSRTAAVTGLLDILENSNIRKITTRKQLEEIKG